MAWDDVIIELGGQTYRGRYRLHGPRIEVETPHGREFAPVGALRAEVAARGMLKRSMLRAEPRAFAPPAPRKPAPQAGGVIERARRFLLGRDEH